jgi:molecular chaperone DnaJ
MKCPVLTAIFCLNILQAFSLDTQTYYEVLGVSLSSNQAEIKKAFRKLAIELHPDKISPSASEEEKDKAKDQFIACQNAYETLFDPFKRNQYNAVLEGVEQDAIILTPERYTKGIFSTTIRTRKIKISFDAQFPIVDKIAEIPLKMEIPLSQVFTGGPQYNQTYYYRKICPICDGSGGFEGICSSCSMCGGKGTALHKYSHRGGHFHQETTTQCGTCNGRGYTVPKKCSHCGGSGMALTEGWLLVDVPLGFAHKQQLVFPGMGHDRPRNTCNDSSNVSINNNIGAENQSVSPLPDGDVVVELLYALPDGYSLLVEGEPHDLQLNMSVPIDTLLRASYSLNIEVPSGEHVVVLLLI